jgi:outer membrane lipoprotein SlyB
MKVARAKSFAGWALAALVLPGAPARVEAQVAPPLPPTTVPNPGETIPCDRCGTIQTIRQVTSKDQWTPLGTVASSGTGGSDLAPRAVTQYQIGRDLSKQGTVLLGAAGGAAYQSRPSGLNAARWEVVVRMDEGSPRTVTQNYQPLMQPGDRVRVYGTQLELL